MPPPTIIFDLDGTLVDTAPDLVDTLNVVLTGEGLRPLPYDDARNYIGGGAKVMIERGLQSQGKRYAPTEVERLFTVFIKHYSVHIADRSQPFPGLAAALDQLAQRGCRFAVCTNKLEGLSRKLLDALGLSKRFAAICGQDTFAVQKPDPEILRRTIAAAGGDPKSALMVGDSITDVRTARALGIPVVAVTFGYSDRPMSELGPDRLISHFQELPDAASALLPVR